MLHYAEPFAAAETSYRRERITTEFRRAARLRVPTGGRQQRQPHRRGLGWLRPRALVTG